MRQDKEAQKAKTPEAGSKKKWIIIAAIAVVLVAAAIAGNTGGSGENDAGSGTTQSEPSAESVESSSEAEKSEPEANTSAKVDALALEAKAAVAEGVTDEKRDEAVAFIVEHYPDYFADNETMERAMTYGFWLEYAYSDDEATRDYAELGMDISQAVKYVYRGAETVEDSATQENLRQIKERLEVLGHSVE
uniref:hypothetical protein n=1 Tax=Candidatus Fimenecus sp. TaxID=3022888 RepID=UPI003FEE9300